jgi:hypothetical protein
VKYLLSSYARVGVVEPIPNYSGLMYQPALHVIWKRLAGDKINELFEV